MTLPPVVQALTVHWAACPRSLLGFAGATSTQRLTCAAFGTVLAPPRALVPVDVPVVVVFAAVFALAVDFAVRVRVGVGVAEALFRTRFEVVGVGDGEAFRVLVAVADGDRLAFAVVLVGVAASVLVGAFVGVTVGLDLSVRVGAGVALDEGVADLVGVPAVPLAVAVGDGLVGAGFDADVVGVAAGVVLVGVAAGVVLVGVGVGLAGVVVGVLGDGVGVVGVGVGFGVGEVGVGDGEGLGDEVGIWSGSQDLLLEVVAAFATEVLPARARPTPEVSRTLPAISVTVAGRACAKRMKSPYPVLLVTAAEPPRHHGAASSGGRLPCRPRATPPIAPQAPGRRQTHPYPTGGGHHWVGVIHAGPG